jgi:hypothetical protein
MKSLTTSIATFLISCLAIYADEPKKETPPKVEFERLLALVQTKKTPSIYSSVYYPRWKKPMDGLKSVAVELIAEHTNREAKRKGLRLKLVGEPVIEGDIAGVLLQRSEEGIDGGIFPAYLFRDEKNGWGYLGFPVPYKRPTLPGIPRDRDDRFYEAALNDATPYDGVLYEFDEANINKYKAITIELEKSVQNQKLKGDQTKVTEDPSR